MDHTQPTAPQTQQTIAITTELDRLLSIRFWASRINLFTRQLAQNQLLGGSRSAFRGRGMEFDEVRRYQAGDDIRAIDWKVTARAQGTYTKLFTEERERPCHIIVDQRHSMFFGANAYFKSVQAAEAAIALAWATLSNGDRIGGQVLAINGHSDLRAKRSKQAVLRFTHDVHTANHDLYKSFAQPSPHADNRALTLAQGLQECERIIRPGTALFIVSDFSDFNESCAKLLLNLAKHTDLTLLQVLDDFEQNLPVNGQLAVSDGQRQSNVNFNSDLLNAYHEHLSAQQSVLLNAARRAKARYVTLSTNSSVRDQLIPIFARK